MPLSAAVVNTPYYVLMDAHRRLGPRVMQICSGTACSPIYGFSDKGSYDKFCMKSLLALTPYPLVKFYLRNRGGAPGDCLKLVVVDAAGPCEPCLHAATMEAVLEAQEQGSTHVTAAHHLTFDEEANAYRMEESEVTTWLSSP